MRLTEFSSSRTQWHKHNKFPAQNGTRFHRINQPETCHTRYDDYNNSDGAFGTPPTFPSSFSSDYQTLLASAFFPATTSDPLNLTLNSLTSGTNYQFEVWVNDMRWVAAGRTETVSDSSGNSVTLAYHTGTLNAGQFVLGTFTADSTGSQAITFTGISTGAQINAFQLRSVASVPEPASLGLVAVGGLGLLLLGKRRHA